MSNLPFVDLHSLYATRSIAKARNYLLRRTGGSSNAGGGGGTGAGGGGSGSLSKSPNFSGVGGMSMVAINNEANRRDDQGRTVLHLAVTEVAEWALEWVELLLSLPGVQVNSADKESGWSALHRALYAGNIAAARQLLARDDIDARLKDHEGLTPFDVYNSTVEGTNPSDSSYPSSASASSNPGRFELFTWGSNRNFVLGFAGDGDRLLPERVNLKREENRSVRGLGKFEPLRVKDVSLGRLHSGIVTDEGRGNLRLCGYGTGGRLGTNAHTQFTFSPLKDFPHQVSSVVLSPDHTVVVTTSGAVYTFGLNRFEQLGYALDLTPNSKSPSDEPIQSSPRRVVGALKKEVVLGAAASRTHTVVFTADSLFTWGTNKGQLGYALGTTGGSVQVMPRKVTALNQPVIMVSATENATACLLESKDVQVLYHEGYVKIIFPLARFPGKMQAYRPPQVGEKPNIVKVASCGNTFAALSSLGDVFTFNLDSSSTTSESASSLARLSPKPQRIWSLRRKFTAVTDVGVGLDGTIILSTVSGHVFVRTRKFEVASIGKSGNTTPTSNSSKGGGWKFSRVPYLQRCIRVSANSTGAFAAIRADVPLKTIDIDGPTLAENLLGILPHWRRIGPLGAKIGSRRLVSAEDEDDEGESDAKIERDIESALRILDVLEKWDESWEESIGGSDAFVCAGTMKIPTHQLVLAARSTTIARHLTSKSTLSLDCSPLTALFLLHYLYSDDLPAIWDARVGLRLQELRPSPKLNVGEIKSQLVDLATSYGLAALLTSLQLHVKTSPSPTLISNIGSVLSSAPTAAPSPLASDIVLELSDRTVNCHSTILRARCTFFSTFYEDEDWTALRRNDGQSGEVLYFDLKHFGWDVMELVLKHVYTDAGVEMFDEIERPTADEYIDFVTQVLAASNELLLDKLKLVCSSVLRSFVTLHNVCSILVDAAFYEANDLVRACMFFIASSLETVLESRLLDDLPADLLTAVSAFCQERQGARMPISRSGILVQDLMLKHKDWLADLDVAKPTGGARKFRPVIPRSPGLSPSMLSPDMSPQVNPRRSPLLRPEDSPTLSPTLVPLRESTDEPFAMDDFSLDGSPTHSSFPNGSTTLPPRRKSLAPSSSPSQPSYMALGSPPPSRLQPWTKVTPDTSKPPTDLRSIMAIEAERRPRTPQTPDRMISRPASSTSLNKITSPVPGQATWGKIGSSGGSWRAPDAPRASISAIQSEQATPQPLPTPPQVSRSLPRTSFPLATPSPPVRPAVDPASGFGPVITPLRLSSTKASGSRATKSSFGAADVPWTNYTVAPASPTHDSFASASMSTSPPRASFASIQSQQRAEVEAIKEVKAPRSFAEVMALEAAEAKSTAEAKEFERWFAAEARKVQAEQGGEPGKSGTASGRGGRGGKTSGKGKGSTGGRGGKKPQPLAGPAPKTSVRPATKAAVTPTSTAPTTPAPTSATSLNASATPFSLPSGGASSKRGQARPSNAKAGSSNAPSS